MKIVLYETNAPLREGERWIAWLTEEQAIVDKDRQRTGETKLAFLPVYFFGDTYITAQERALAFWNDEKAKAAGRTERGRKLGQSRSKAAA